MKTDVIINRDALYALRELPSESVNCCVTSPPYYGLRDYGLDAQIGREDTPEQYIGRLVEQFAILIDSRTRFETGEPGGYWLSMPATKEQLHEAMQSVGITADNPQEFFIHGYYHLEDKRIALDEGMSELQTLKTLIHEIAHAKLHDIDLNAPLEDLENRPDRRTREVQAESIAYTVCQHYGLDTSDYSFGYVAGWSAGRELAELKSSLETIRSAAAEIINSIDGHIAELQKEQAQDAPREKAAMPEYIYKIEANPRTTGDNDRFFLQAYLPQENGRAKIGDVLYIGSLAKCRELMGGLNAGELTQGEVKELYAKAQEAEADKDTFSIYQLKQGDETRDFRFEPYDRLQAAGNVVDKTNYELVYSAELTPGTSLEDIYTRFNIDHPKDFKGHSLSVSDVVVLHQNGQDAAHYVDSFGYKEVPEFLQEQTQQPEKINPLKHVEDTIEQNDNNFDGIINNTPTVDELEAKVKAGEQISLVDLAEAIKADKERGKEKPSIRAQLKADKERTGKKKNAKQKSQDLERS